MTAAIRDNLSHKIATSQCQVADKVQIEISKAAVGGYQGQDPVAPDASSQS